MWLLSWSNPSCQSRGTQREGLWSCPKRRLCPCKLQGGVCEDHSLPWQSPVFSTRSCGQDFTDHSCIRCRVGFCFISWLFCSFPALQSEVGLCSCGMHVLPSVPLVLVTVLCWKSPHSHAVKLHKYPFINDLLACACTLVQSGAVLGMPVFLRGAGSDLTVLPTYSKNHYVMKKFLYVPIPVKTWRVSFFRWWDSSLCSAGPPEIPLAARTEHWQGYSRVR